MMFKNLLRLGLVWLILIYSSQGYAAFVNATGYLGLLGSGVFNPHGNALGDNYQATEEYFGIDFEIKSGDLISLYLDLRLWPHDEGALLGDEFGKLDQGADFYFYEDLAPRVTEFYLEAATKICLLSAGRRARQVGLGMFINEASDPFDTAETLFEGVSCDIRSGMPEQLGISFGLDKLREGDPSNSGDDLTQMFAQISFDDRGMGGTHPLKKQVALYFAYVSSSKPHDFGEQKDKYLDLLAGLYYENFSWESEGLIRMGKAAGKSWEIHGARPERDSKINGFAVYTTLKYAYPAPSEEPSTDQSHSAETKNDSEQSVDGLSNMPESDFFTQSPVQHEVALEYIFSPGDRQGYYKGANRYLSESKRSDAVTAIPLNVNFKPALLLFNMRTDAFDIDGIYSGDRIVNAHVFTAGYSLSHPQYGGFEAKVISALMDKEMPDYIYSYFYHNPIEKDSGLEEYYEFPSQAKVPVGFYGRYLGTEIDLTYEYSFTENVSLSLTGGYLIPGKALEVDQKNLKNTFGVDIALLFTL